MANPVVTAGNANRSSLDGASISVENNLFGETEPRIASALIANLERNASLLRDAHHLLALLDAKRHRLLAKHVLSGFHRRNRYERMPMVGCADADRINRRISNDLTPVEHLAARLVAIELIHHVLDDSGATHVATDGPILVRKTLCAKIAATLTIEIVGSHLDHVARNRYTATRILEKSRYVCALSDKTATDDCHIHFGVRRYASRRHIA